MSSWLVAAVVGVAAALVQYGRLPVASPAIRASLGLLRGVALTLATALLLDAPLGQARPVRPWAFVDASLSMTRGGSLSAAAWDTAAGARAESVWTFGDTLSRGDARSPAGAPRTTAGVAVERALSGGHPAIVVTDGELQDPASVNDLVNGSRVVVLPRRTAPDAAITTLDVPRAAVAGDTIEARVTIASGASAVAAGTLTLRLDDRDAGRWAIEPMSSWSERQIVARIATAGQDGTRVLRAVLSAPGDVEPRNDTLAAALEISRAASAVFVSTSPDQDSRFALSVLRGVLALPTRGYLRVAPGVWRDEGTLGAATEADVRAALRDAPVAIIHGDSAIFGPPMSATRGPVALIVPPDSDTGEWYASGTPPSPLSTSMASVPLDSLPPVSAGVVAAGDWSALEVRRGRSGARRAIVTGRETPRRRVTVTGSGFWRWRFRGGVSADAYASLWGGIFDWLAAERADKRAALPVATSVRAGDAIRWQRGSATDTLVDVRLARRGVAGDAMRYTLRFSPDVAVRETPAPAPGIYDVAVPGGRTAIVVNQSAELLPARPRVQSGAVGRRPPPAAVPGARSMGALYALVVLLLCAEWLGRRRAGLR